MTQIKILFLCPYPHDTAPSQRFRFEQFFRIMDDKGLKYKQYAFLSQWGWRILYAKGKSLAKAVAVLQGFLRRMIHLMMAVSYDYVLIHRELSPLGPPVFEWLLAKVFRKKVIYDFDDAIWLTDSESRFINRMKFFGKVGQIIRWSYKASCGNQYLHDYAKGYNSRSFIIPTTIDTVFQHNKLVEHQRDLPVIGWTGSHSTMPYLMPIIPVIKKLQEIYGFTFMVISNKDPKPELANYEFVRWDKHTEIQDLSRLNIGIMPLPDDKWAKGKCGFKALQYMALGVPAVVSPVGVNTKMIKENQNGYLCATTMEWEERLEQLIKDKELRRRLGASGRKFVVENYSTAAVATNFLELFS